MSNPTTFGRYKVVSILGSGGMGSLFQALDPVIDRIVAIKVLRQGADSPELRTRFAREARTAGRLQHPNIVTIFDVGEYENQPFIAMEYVSGQTLASLLQSQTTLPLSRKIKLLEELCDGLAYAHSNGLVHRDIKPTNLMVDPKGMLKILDFGIVRVADSGMTADGSLVGTLPYMSPEQVAGRTVDHRSDIFAVGDVAYELLSGRQAFPGKLNDGILDRIQHTNPPPLEELCPTLPAEIPRIVTKAMEKDPANRYQDLVAMRNDLERIRERVQKDEARGASGATEMPTLPRQGRGPAKPPSTIRPPTSGLMARREALIQEHLEGAAKALEAGEFENAIARAEEAALLDPAREQAQQIIDEASVRIRDRQVQQMLLEARRHLNRGEPTLAAKFVEDALELDPTSPEVQAVRRNLEDVRRELELAEEQARVVFDVVNRARAHLSAGAYDLAIRAVDEVLARQSTHPEAVDIKRQAVALQEERVKKEKHDQAARLATDGARREFAEKRYDRALTMLEQFTPPHDLVSRVLNELRVEVAKIRAAEKEARNQKVAALVSAVHQTVKAGYYDQALGIIGRIREIDPESETAAGLTEDLLQRKHAAEEAARSRQMAEAKARIAAEAFEKHEFAAAAGAVEEALRFDPQNQPARALRELIEEQRRVAAAHCDAARQALAHEQVEHALQEIEAARAIDPSLPAVQELEARARAAQATIEKRRAEERLRAERAARDQERRQGPVEREPPERKGGISAAYIGIAAVCVLALGGGIYLAMRGGATTDTGQSSSVEVQVPPIPVDPAPPVGGTESQPPDVLTTTGPSEPSSPAGPTVPPASSNTQVTPPQPDPSAAANAALAPVRLRARQQLDAGQTEDALATAQGGLKIKSDDAELRRLLDGMWRTASADTTSARNEASAANASASAALQFDRAIQQERDAASEQKAGRIDGAIRGLWAARDSFRQATVVATRAAEDRQRELARQAAAQQTPAQSAQPARGNPEVGIDAFRRARQYDALGRANDAIAWYERAFKELPDTDPNKKVAGERLAALRRGR